MKRRPLRVEQALDLLPNLEALLPVRRALMRGALTDERELWAGWASHATLDTRPLSAESLEAQIPGLVQREADRTRLLYSAIAEAMRQRERGNESAAAAALVDAGEIQEEAGHLASAVGFYERAQALGSGLRDRRPQSLALRRLARVAKARGRLDQSLEHYASSYGISSTSGDRDGAVVACQGMGNVRVEQGLWSEAAEWYQKGLQLLDGSAPTRPLWQLQSNLSLVARRMGELEKSRQWLDSAQLTVDRLADAAGRVYVLNAEGLLLLAWGDPAAAELRYRQALEHATSGFESARVLVNLGEALVIQGQLAGAEAIFRQLERLALAESMVSSLPYAYRGLGAVAKARGDSEGFLFFEQALELCRSGELPEFEFALTQLEYAEFESGQQLHDSAMSRLEEALAHFTALGTEPERKRAEDRLRSIKHDDPQNQE